MAAYLAEPRRASVQSRVSAMHLWHLLLLSTRESASLWTSATPGRLLLVMEAAIYRRIIVVLNLLVAAAIETMTTFAKLRHELRIIVLLPETRRALRAMKVFHRMLVVFAMPGASLRRPKFAGTAMDHLGIIHATKNWSR